MAPRFIALTSKEGKKLMVNAEYIFMAQPSDGTNFSQGASLCFIDHGNEGVREVQLAQYDGDTSIDALLFEAGSQFIECVTLAGYRTIINKGFITHVEPLHGDDIANGAVLFVFGARIEIGAKEVPALLEILATI